MASINDLILKQVQSAASGVDIPSNIKEKVLGGLSESVLGSLTQTAAKAGGIDQIKNLLTGKESAASSPITALAGKLFNTNILSKLNLGALAGTLSGLVPKVMGGLGGIFKDRDGDGDVDLNDILMALKGGNSGASSILGAATGILGGLFKKK